MFQPLNVIAIERSIKHFIMNPDIRNVRCNFPNFFWTTIGPFEDVKQ
jgi:hypothetical protein